MSRLTRILLDLESRGKTNYLKTKIIYEKYSIECQQCCNFNVDTKCIIAGTTLSKDKTII
jgi:hypothetical protein